MPISRVLNATTIVSVPTMLNAATIMMKKITRPIASFSSCSAENNVVFLRLPRLGDVRKSELELQSGRDGLDIPRVAHPNGDIGHRRVEPGDPLGGLPVHERVRVVVDVHPGLEDAGNLHRPAARRIQRAGDAVPPRGARRDDVDDITHGHRQVIGEPPAENHGAVDIRRRQCCLEGEVTLISSRCPGERPRWFQHPVRGPKRTRLPDTPRSSAPATATRPPGPQRPRPDPSQSA